MAQQQGGGQALPWAVQSVSRGKASESLATLATNDLAPMSIDQLGLAVGDRIEVKWHIESEEEGSSHTKWWGASIAGLVPAAEQQQGQQSQQQQQQQQQQPSAPGGGGSTSSSRQGVVYQLRYDADEGFEEELSEVVLLTEHELFDRAHRGVMLWRREGDDQFDPPDDEEEEDDDDEGDMVLPDAAGGGEEDGEVTGGTVSVAQLAEMMGDAPASPQPLLSGLAGSGGRAPPAPGSSLAALHEAAQRDPAAAAAMEASLKDFMEQFKLFAYAKAECGGGDGQGGAGGGGGVITREDVAEFERMMRTQAATRGRRGAHKP